MGEKEDIIGKIKRLSEHYKHSKKIYKKDYWEGYTQALSDVLELIE